MGNAGDYPIYRWIGYMLREKEGEKAKSKANWSILTLSLTFFGLFKIMLHYFLSCPIQHTGNVVILIIHIAVNNLNFFEKNYN